MKRSTKEIAQAKFRKAKILFDLLHQRLLGTLPQKQSRNIERDLKKLEFCAKYYSTGDRFYQGKACIKLYAILELGYGYPTVRDRVKVMLREIANEFFQEESYQLEFALKN